MKRLEYVGSMRASAYITIGMHEPTGSVQPARTSMEPLRLRVAADLARCEAAGPAPGGIGRPFVLYKEERLSNVLGVKGRRHSGVGDVTDLDVYCGEVLTHLVETKGLSSYQATRSSFAAPKWYKEFVRPASTMDPDLKASFPTAISLRHPDLQPVCEWVHDRRRCLDLCELDEAHLNDLKWFCNSAAGSGAGVE
eukprot:8955879-Alexandrium_andersonii.AAC.1